MLSDGFCEALLKSNKNCRSSLVKNSEKSADQTLRQTDQTILMWCTSIHHTDSFAKFQENFPNTVEVHVTDTDYYKKKKQQQKKMGLMNTCNNQ